MAFSQKEYFFSHTMTGVSQAHQPAVFKIDLRGLIPFGDYSTLFVIDRMSVTAYKRGTLERIPVKFAVLNDTKKRVLTNDPCKLSSEWQVDINSGSRVKIAGTDTEPFNRTLTAYDDENRQALLNVLSFMMSKSLWASDDARGAFEVLVDATRGAFEFTCDLCSEMGIVHVTKGPNGLPSFSFPQCFDGYVCVPSQQTGAHKDYEALRDVLTLLRTACLDNLDIFKQVTREMATTRAFRELDCTSFPPEDVYTGKIVIPYTVLKYITSLYRTMSEYADNFAIVDDKTPHVKILIESPSETIGEITGCISLTVIYGYSVSEIYCKLSHGLQHAEGCEEVEEEEEEEEQQQQIDSLAKITQLTNDVLIRRTPLKFRLDSHMTLRDWYNFYYGRNDRPGEKKNE